MNSLTYVLKITAIALNTYFSAWLLLFVCSGYGGHPLSLYAWLSGILICAVPPVTLITIALTFHKNRKILTSVLRIIAIILNAYILIVLIWFEKDPRDYLVLYLMYCGFAVLNLVALALTLRKVKENTRFYLKNAGFAVLKKDINNMNINTLILDMSRKSKKFEKFSIFLWTFGSLECRFVVQ